MTEDALIILLAAYFVGLALAIVFVEAIAINREKYTFMQIWMKGISVFWRMEDYFDRKYIFAIKALTLLWLASWFALFVALSLLF